MQNKMIYKIENDMQEKQNQLLLIHQDIISKLDYFYKQNKIPHIIFHGNSGSGKRTIVDQFLHKIYQNDTSSRQNH